MRNWGRVVAALAVAACSGSAPSTQPITGQNVGLLASEASEEAPAIVYNTQLRSDIEVPACETESQGLAQIKIFQDGRMRSVRTHSSSGPGCDHGTRHLVAIEPRRHGPQPDRSAHRHPARWDIRIEPAFHIRSGRTRRIAEQPQQLLRQLPFGSLPRRYCARILAVTLPTEGFLRARPVVTAVRAQHPSLGGTQLAR